MVIRRIVLSDQTTSGVDPSQMTAVAAALQTQLDRDFSPIWGPRAQVTALASGDAVPPRTWPVFIVDQPDAGLGVHLDQNGKPFAEVQSGDTWSITASHELLEMLVDPLGHKFRQAPDIDPAVGDQHLVSYLEEICDPCEVYSYAVDGVDVSDFVTPDYYDGNSPDGTQLDFLSKLAKPFDVPQGCYISWQDPVDQRWHQKTPDGQFVTAQRKINPRNNPRDDRDKSFGEAEARYHHGLPGVVRGRALGHA